MNLGEKNKDAVWDSVRDSVHDKLQSYNFKKKSLTLSPKTTNITNI